MRLQEFIKYLISEGCDVKPRNNTFIVTNPANGHIASFHASNPIDNGVVKSVCRDLGIPSPILKDSVVQQGATLVTYHSDDVLPEVKYAGESVGSSSSLVASAADEDVSLADISGCVALIGPLQVCYAVDLSNLIVEISVKVGPVTVAKAEISKAHPCITLSGNYKVAKWDLTICLDLDQRKVVLSGKACVTFLGCKSFNVTIFQW